MGHRPKKKMIKKKKKRLISTLSRQTQRLYSNTHAQTRKFSERTTIYKNENDIP